MPPFEETFVNPQPGRHFRPGLGDKLISQGISQQVEHGGEIHFDLSAGLGDNLYWELAFHHSALSLSVDRVKSP